MLDNHAAQLATENEPAKRLEKRLNYTRRAQALSAGQSVGDDILCQFLTRPGREPARRNLFCLFCKEQSSFSLRYACGGRHVFQLVHGNIIDALKYELRARYLDKGSLLKINLRIGILVRQLHATS